MSDVPASPATSPGATSPGATPPEATPPTVAFATLGCKLNYAETMTYARQFRARGYAVVDESARADVVVVNTCSVTENADREARKLVRRALRRSADTYVVVVGCYAQLQPEAIASIDGVDLVLGAREKFDMLAHVADARKTGQARVLVGDVSDADDFGAAYAADADDRTRSFLKVQDGCDYSCAFCTIPLARGASRSLDVARTVAYAEEILGKGFREIVLSGVNVGDYGAKIGSSLSELVGAIIALPGDFRLRISSIEPNLLTDEIIAMAVGSGKLCPHFHIPLQSGSPDILRAMRRRYNREQYAERLGAVRRALPHAGIGIDVIVGFPGETEEHFLETYSFLVDTPCTYLHVFSYSERPDTHAVTLGGRVPHEERARRSRMLRILSEKKRHAFYASQAGTVRRVLFEARQEGALITGFTENHVRVGVPYDAALANTLQAVRLGAVDGDLVRGTLAPHDSAAAAL